MRVIKEGNKPPTPWKKTITCSFMHTRTSFEGKAETCCGAIFEIGEKDVKVDGYDDDGKGYYIDTSYVTCPSCKNSVDLPEVRRKLNRG
jgi:hypothetical protein